MQKITDEAKKVLSFWFDDHGPEKWFQKNAHFDQLIEKKFSDLLLQAMQNELWPWRDTPEGCLAEIILLDQFTRNVFRDTPQAFTADPQALALAQETVRRQFDIKLPPNMRKFLYMPYMHSESKAVHESCLPLFKSLNDPKTLDFEYQHKAIIDHFSRYPHRNKILGRKNTPEETEFLKTDGSHF